MTPRHATTVVLVGWYLMVPPPPSPKGSGVIGDEPLSQWIIAESFDSAAECTQDWKRRMGLASDSFDKLKAEIHAANSDRLTVAELPPKLQREYVKVVIGAGRINGAKCIASDDARLKGNKDATRLRI